MHSIVFCLVAGLCGTALVAQTPSPAEATEAKVIEWSHSVRHWDRVAELDDGFETQRGLPHFRVFRSQRDVPDQKVSLLGRPIPSLLGDDSDLEEILQHVLPTGVELRFVDQGQRLVVRGQRIDVTRAAQRIRAIERWLTRGIEVRATAYALPPDQVPSRAVWRPEEVAAVRSAHQPVWEGIGVTRPGMTARLGGLSERRYVHGAYVEIAKNSRQYVPDVRRYFTGSEVHVRVHALPDRQDLVLFAQFVHASTASEPPRTLRWLPEQPRLHAPVVQLESGSLSGRISDHGAISYSAQTTDRAMLLLITCRWTEPPIDPLPDIGFAPSGLWRETSLGARCPIGTDGQWTAADADAMPFLGDQDELHEALTRFATDAVPSLAAPDQSIYPVEGSVMLFGSVAQRAAIQRNLGERLETALENVRVEIGHTAAARPVRILRFAALAGRNHTWASGQQQLGVTKVSAEVAEGSNALVLERKVQHSGLRGWILPWRGGGDGASIDLVASQPRTGPELTTRALGRYRIPLASTDQTRHRHHGIVRPGRALDLGDGPPQETPGDDDTSATRKRTRVTIELHRD